jgi:predicted flavoprotein YhiN
MRQKEYADADEDVGEKVFLTTVVGVINITHDNERKDQVEQKPEGHHQKVVAIEKFDPKELGVANKLEQ